MAYDYLVERYQLSQLTHAAVCVTEDPAHWGARQIEALIADDRLLMRITDAQFQDTTTGQVLRVLSEWPPQRRLQFCDLHWCVEVFDVASGRLLACQQAIDTSMHELRASVKLALEYALYELEPVLCTMI